MQIWWVTSLHVFKIAANEKQHNKDGKPIFCGVFKKIIRKLKGRTEYLTKTYSQKLNKEEEENRKLKKPEKQTNWTHI